MAPALENRELKGVTIKTIGFVIGAVATVVSSYFFTMANINGRIDSVDKKIDNVDRKMGDIIYRDSLRLQIMQFQIDQIRQDIMANRIILKDIRDTQVLK